MTAFREKAPPAPYLRIVNILFQSAAVNIPIAITAFVGLAFNKDFVIAVLPVVGASQASYVIISVGIARPECQLLGACVSGNYTSGHNGEDIQLA